MDNKLFRYGFSKEDYDNNINYCYDENKIWLITIIFLSLFSYLLTYNFSFFALSIVVLYLIKRNYFTKHLTLLHYIVYLVVFSEIIFSECCGDNILLLVGIVSIIMPLSLVDKPIKILFTQIVVLLIFFISLSTFKKSISNFETFKICLLFLFGVIANYVRGNYIIANRIEFDRECKFNLKSVTMAFSQTETIYFEYDYNYDLFRPLVFNSYLDVLNVDIERFRSEFIFTDNVDDSDQLYFSEALNSLSNNDAAQCEIRFIKDNKPFWINFKFNKIKGKNREVIVGSAQDINQQKLSVKRYEELVGYSKMVSKEANFRAVIDLSNYEILHLESIQSEDSIESFSDLFVFVYTHLFKEKDKRDFTKIANIEYLIDQYDAGNEQHELELEFNFDNFPTRFYKLKGIVIFDPINKTYVLYTYAIDTSKENYSQEIISNVLAIEYDFAARIDLSYHDNYYVFDARNENKSEIGNGEYFFTYFKDFIIKVVASNDYDRMMNIIEKQNIIERLIVEKSFRIYFDGVTKEGQYCRKCLHCYYLNEKVGSIGIILSDITLIYLETLKHENELKNTFKLLEEVNGIKNKLFDSISEKVITPINNIVANTELAIDEERIENTKEYLQNIKKSTDYLQYIIDETVKLNDFDPNNVVINTTKVDMVNFYENVERLVAKEAKAKNINIITTMDLGNYSKLKIDKIILKEILVNILRNTISITSENRELNFVISHNLIETKVHCCYQVSDLDQEQIANARNIYNDKRVRDDVLDRTINNGFNLAVTKNLVDVLGGQVSCKSKRDNYIIFDLDFEFETETRLIDQNINLSILRNQKILIVEDNDINAKITSRILNKVGITCERVENGQAAIDLLLAKEENYFDLVLMDIRMPIKNGLETTKEIRTLNYGNLKTVPIIALTASTFDSQIQQCFDAGMNNHISKPIDAHGMYQKISAAICRKRL